jgi:hypothetical protein
MASTDPVVSARIQVESQTKVMSTLRMFSTGRCIKSVHVSLAVHTGTLLTHGRERCVSANFNATGQRVFYIRFIQRYLHLAECFFEE